MCGCGVQTREEGVQKKMTCCKKMKELTEMKIAKIFYYVGYLLLFFLFTTLAYMGNTQWRFGLLRDSPNDCIDYNPCTLDVLLPDDTCQFRLKKNGTHCGDEDRCYWHSTRPEIDALVCVNNKCIAPDITTCKGYCLSTPDCIGMMDSLFVPDVSTTYTTFTSCISNGCISFLILPNSTLNHDAVTYLDQSSSDNLYQTQCLHSQCTTLQNSTTMCTYYYQCAPVIFV